MTNTWKTIKSRIVYENRWIILHEDEVLRPDGKKGTYTFLERADAVFVIAVNANNEIYFIREYRYPLKKEILQIPAGQAEKETLEESAYAELFEETGLKAKSIKKLGSFVVAPGHDKTRVHAMLATNFESTDTSTKNTAGNETILEVTPIKENKVKEMMANGEIDDALTLAALSIYFANEK